jgi:hypothetical protein
MHLPKRHCRLHRKWLLLATVPLCGSLLMATSQAAFAGDVYGNPSQIDACGYTFSIENGIHTHTGESSYADISISTNVTGVPAGCDGGQPIMWYGSGAMCREGGWIYNGDNQQLIDPEISPGCGSGQAYYSQGFAEGWTGSGYIEYSTYPSPDQNS